MSAAPITLQGAVAALRIEAMKLDGKLSTLTQLIGEARDVTNTFALEVAESAHSLKSLRMAIEGLGYEIDRIAIQAGM